MDRGCLVWLAKDDINGLKQPSWTYYLNTLENKIRLCYGDISITNIFFQCHISMQILMNSSFGNLFTDFW